MLFVHTNFQMCVNMQGSFEKIQELSAVESLPLDYLQTAKEHALDGCYVLGLSHKYVCLVHTLRMCYSICMACQYFVQCPVQNYDLRLLYAWADDNCVLWSGHLFSETFRMVFVMLTEENMKKHFQLTLDGLFPLTTGA